MKDRILYGWTIHRIFYLVLGGIVAVQSVVEGQYWGLALGGYFVAMGVFNFGCAAGGCYGNACAPPARKSNSTPNISNVDFEEVKTN